MNNIKSGFLTSEFSQKIGLYILAGYVIYKGYTPDQVHDAISAVQTQVTEYREIFVVLAALIAPLVDNIFYTKKRTELKMAKGEQ